MEKPVQETAPVLFFKSPKEFAKWLATNHTAQAGVWLQMFKKHTGTASITYAEALDEALCYGWIDGQKKSHDSESWIQKFTPRRAKSIWSKRNIEHIERLVNANKMKPAGLKQVEAAKQDGRWHRAYDSPGKMEVPQDFMQQLSKNKKALAFFESLNKANKYAITWRLQTAVKPETRSRRMALILEMLKKGERFH
jgi:uncharacterized protein YdeI (YjbR/CyaY-like superfamily)